MTSLPLPLGRLRGEIGRRLANGEGSLYLYKSYAGLIDHRPTNLLGWGAVGSCFLLSRNQASTFLKHTAMMRTRERNKLARQADHFGGSKKGFVLKLLSPRSDLVHLRSDLEDVSARFLEEGRLGTKMAPHKNVVAVYAVAPLQVELGRWAHVNSAAILEEYGGAATLESIVPDRRRGLKSRLVLGLQLCSAVAHLHTHGIIHRDIKPANTFLENRSLKLGDLGVHRASSAPEPQLTATGQEGLGTYKYMAPEQAADSKRCGSAADVFALGVTLVELLIGRNLRKRDDVLGLAGMSRSGRRPRARTLASVLPSPSYSEGDQSLVLKIANAVGPALQWDAARRCSASDLESRLRNLA